MKNVCVFLFCFFIYSASNSLYSQARENRDIISFELKGEKLDKATGWVLNKETGQWVSNKNSISQRNVRRSMLSTVPNFSWLKFAKTKHNDQVYYVLYYKTLSGRYKYPNIQQNWETENRKYFFVFSENQYLRMKNDIDNLSGETLDIESNMAGNITDYYQILGGEHLFNDANFLAKITNSLNHSSSVNKRCFSYNSQTIDNVEVFRFMLPSVFCNELKESYFEIELSTFKNILID